MYLITPLTLLLAALISAPALWQLLVTGDLDLTSALERYLLAVPVAVLMVAGMRALTNGYRRSRARASIREGQAAGRRPARDGGDAPTAGTETDVPEASTTGPAPGR